MSRAKFYAATAMGLCVAVAPLTTAAQMVAFVPQVEICVGAPSIENCHEFGAVLAECADDLVFNRCELLFEDTTAVFQYPAQLEQAQMMLAQTSAALEHLGFTQTLSGTTEGAETDENALQRLRDALAAGQRDVAAANADTPENDRTETASMAADAPELVIEAEPEEEFAAPADAQRQPDREQQAALDRLVQEPEVAAAITLLGKMVDEIEADETHDQPRTEFPAALFALQRAQRGETGGDAPEAVIDQEITADEIRSSRDDFGTRLTLHFDPEQTRPEAGSDLDRSGLRALGALAVGMTINRSQVVARSSERVVVRRDDGEYAVWGDEDAILNQEGSQRWIERYADGSTLTRWERRDGSWTISIRDATGRALWRERIMPDGTSIELVNEMRQIEPVDVSALPPPLRRELRITRRTDLELALVVLRDTDADARALGRLFTLRQVREVRQLRELMPVISAEPITFASNRANVRAEEAEKLTLAGRLIERLIADNPRELFLIEGHTDAAGPAAFNLALADRRAESVALALSEVFAIPPENLIIQGYGEHHLQIPTAQPEEGNRRVSIRRISPLLGQ